MTIRTGMSDLIAQLRENTSAAPDEFSIGNTTYWMDPQLQDVLDESRYDVFREPLEVQISYDDNNVAQYYDYYFEYGNVEQANSGSAAWEVENAAGSAIGTANYTVNYHARHIRFTASTLGSALYLNYRYFNVEAAAADVWQKKAANVASRYDVKTDNHDLKRSQLFTMYTKMANLWRARALSSQGSSESFLTRTDVNA